MVEVEGLAPPEWLDVSQLPWLLGDTSTKMALVIGLAPTDFPSTEGWFDYFTSTSNGQVGGIRTRFPGFTGRCSAD